MYMIYLKGRITDIGNTNLNPLEFSFQNIFNFFYNLKPILQDYRDVISKKRINGLVQEKVGTIANQASRLGALYVDKSYRQHLSYLH